MQPQPPYPPQNPPRHDQQRQQQQQPQQQPQQRPMEQRQPNPNPRQPQAYPQQQPNQPQQQRQPSPVVNRVDEQMGNLQINEAAPARAKRAPRAYHVNDQAPPPPNQPHQQQFNGQQDQMNQPQQYQGQPEPAQQRQREHVQQQQQQFQQQGQFNNQQLQQPRQDASFQNNNSSSAPRMNPRHRVKIDPDHIPSPVTMQELDQELYNTEPYLTCSRVAAPLSTTDFVAIDQGNCSPRFLRMTTYCLPHTDDLAAASQLPLGLIVQPFAKLRPEEGEVPVVTFDEVGPPRCQRCRGYINAWCAFIDGGQKFVCNLCGAATEVTPEYFGHLDMAQRRLDINDRPELRLGSVDFVVGKDYWVQESDPASTLPPREPSPLSFVFAIDISWTSGRIGLVQEVVEGLKELLYPEVIEGQPAPLRLPAGSKIAIMTFDKTVQFYNLKSTLEQAHMLVVGDLLDMFVPLSEGYLVDPDESRTIIEMLLESLPAMAAENQTVEAAIGGPARAAQIALKSLGGQINIFQTCLPTIGPGILKNREDNKLYGTDKEKTLFVPQDPFYRLTAEECVEYGIGVNLFLFPSQYIDVATLGILPGLTGGELFFYPRFERVRDGGKLRADIKRVGSRETGYSVTMRIRCSNGLRIADHFGNFFQRNVTDLEFGNIDADKAIAARIKHEGKLDEKVDAHFQCAVLYTSASGQRRVRVHNIAVPVTGLLASVFRLADMDTTLAYIAKESITQTASKPLKDVRMRLSEVCVKALLAYRKNCASSTSPAQLILPESFKLFPLYALALMKSKALKGGPVASDVRTWQMRLLKSAGVAATIGLLYPRMLPVHTFTDDIGFRGENGRVTLPPLIRLSYARLEPHGAYLIENGEIAILWLGSSVSPQILRDLYGVEDLKELDVRMQPKLPILNTRLSTQLRNVISVFETQRGGRRLPVLIARQNIDGTEVEFSNMLVEDANNEQLSYIDYLCSIHAQIQADLLGETKKVEFDSSFTTW